MALTFEGYPLSQANLDSQLDNLDKIRDPAAWEQKQQRLAKEKREAKEKAKHERERLAEESKQEQQRLADQGNANSQFALGGMYEEGLSGIPKDIDKAKDLYQKAADQEHVLAMQRLCVLSEDCTPAPESPDFDSSPSYTGGAPQYTGKSTGGGAEALFALCLLTPYIQWVCGAAVLGAM